MKGYKVLNLDMTGLYNDNMTYEKGQTYTKQNSSNLYHSCYSSINSIVEKFDEYRIFEIDTLDGVVNIINNMFITDKIKILKEVVEVKELVKEKEDASMILTDNCVEDAFAILLEENQKMCFLTNENNAQKILKKYLWRLRDQSLFDLSSLYGYEFDMFSVPYIEGDYGKIVCIFANKNIRQNDNKITKTDDKNDYGTHIHSYGNLAYLPKEYDNLQLYIQNDVIQENQDSKIKKFSNKCETIFIKSI